MCCVHFYGKDKLDYKNLLHNNEYIIAQQNEKKNYERMKEGNTQIHTHFVLLMERFENNEKKASLLCFPS